MRGSGACVELRRLACKIAEQRVREAGSCGFYVFSSEVFQIKCGDECGDEISSQRTSS